MNSAMAVHLGRVRSVAVDFNQLISHRGIHAARRGISQMFHRRRLGRGVADAFEDGLLRVLGGLALAAADKLSW